MDARLDSVLGVLPDNLLTVAITLIVIDRWMGGGGGEGCVMARRPVKSRSEYVML
jgi:hypothetical protein